jgi:hypothetical protein
LLERATVGSADYCRRGSISNVFHALHEGPNGHPNGGLFGSSKDAARFIPNLNQMIRGFVAGNLIVGSVMAVATMLMLWGVGIQGAMPLGIASGLLNLLPSSD